jgi:hypothetical protein
MPDVAEVHVGDIGTLYRVRVQDENGDFDPSSASVKELIFQMPGVADPVVRDAAVLVGSGDEAGQWFLTYTVTEADVDTSPAEFHGQAGRVTIQGYLEWVDGDRYHSNRRTLADDGTELRVHRNLR